MLYNGERMYHIGLKKGEAGRYVILTGDPGRCEKIASLLDSPVFVAQNREFTTYNGFINGELVTVSSTGIGGPSAAISMEELALSGGKYFIRVGSCGGMQPFVRGGDAVIASAAVRMEGTSREYMPAEFPAVADFEVLSAIASAAKDIGAPHHVGIVQSKDSFYGQHEPESMPVAYELESKWQAWIKGGVLASEMETAALFTVAAVRGLKAGALFYVVGNQEREKKGLANNMSHDPSAVAQIAVDAMKKLIEKEG